MASQANGGCNVPGNLHVSGDGQINGDVVISGTLSTAALSATTLALTSLTAATHIKLTPTASPPAGAAEGMIYADTDHKLYYYNGTDWKEVAFAA